MHKLQNFYKNNIQSRFIYFFFFLGWIILFPFSFSFQINKKKTKLCIEAGAKGWESIEYKELYQSAIEFLKPEDVMQIVVDKNKSYLQQLCKTIYINKPTHYLYDPRTGAQDFFSALLQSLAVACIFQANRIIPIVLLTDCADRTWRTQSAIITAHEGAVITFISVREIASIFPHRRIIGPSLMPFSQSTLKKLHELRLHPYNKNTRTATFVGSLYEPRISKLKKINKRLQELGFNLEIKGRLPGIPRISDQLYWETLVSSAIGFTTADQVETDRSDWTWIPHMVYRYLEVTAAGSLLVAPNVAGLERYFSPEIHFAKYETIDEAINVIRYYLEHPLEREVIAKEGLKRASTLIEARIFWTSINAGLGKNALL